MRFKKYKDKVYGINYCFVFDIVDIKKVPDFLKKKDTKIYKWYKSINVEHESEFSGKTIQNGNNMCILLMKEKDTAFLTATIVHELLHCMFFAFGERSVEIQQGGKNEHCTYYLDHLVYEALKK